MTHRRDLFAVIPAAGISRRMGAPKLLFAVDGRTMIQRVLQSLTLPGITDRVVVIRNDDDDLRRELSRLNASVVRPAEKPPDMRRSVEHALDFIRQRHAPDPDAGWLLVPADCAALTSAVVARLLEAWHGTSARVLVPTCEGRRGHPTFFRWDLAEAVPGLPHDQGVNGLISANSDDIVEIEIGDIAVVTDIDTPADYSELRKRIEASD